MATYESLVIKAIFKLEKRRLESLKSAGVGVRVLNWFEALSKEFIYEPLGYTKGYYPAASEKTDEDFVYPQSPGAFMNWLMAKSDKDVFIFVDEKTGHNTPQIKSALAMTKDKAQDFIVANKKLAFESDSTTFQINVKATKLAEHYEDKS